MDRVVHIISAKRVLSKTLIDESRTQRGTGVHIGNGYVLTNFHVVPDTVLSLSIYSPFKGEYYNYEGVIKYSKMFDLSLIKTNMVGEEMPIGNNPNIGDRINALGFLSGNNLSHVTSEGKVMSFDSGGLLARHDAKCLYMLCSINAGPGFSGGPVRNEEGELIGIASAGLTTINGLLFVPSVIIKKFLSCDNNVDAQIAFSYLRTYGGIVSKNVDCHGIEIGDTIKSINGYRLRDGFINLRELIDGFRSDVYALPYLIFPLFNAGDVLQIETDKGTREHTLRSVSDYFGNNNYKVMDDLVICDIYNDLLADNIIDDILVYHRYGKPHPVIIHSFNNNNWNFVGCHIISCNTTDEVDENIRILYNYSEIDLRIALDNKYY